MKVGFVINSRVPNWRGLWERRMPPQALLLGWDDAGSPMSFMRFRWLAEHVGGKADYEIFKPWRTYDVVVFVKSMGSHVMQLVKALQDRGTRVVFDANVDYYSGDPEQQAPFAEMIPSQTQRDAAAEITRQADLVIASSRHLAELCGRIAPRSVWIPDNVKLGLVPGVAREPVGGPLPLWWSGMPEKLFEFLLIEEPLRAHARSLHLHFVTNSLDALERWPSELRERFAQLLRDVPHTLHRFRAIPELLALYRRGGCVLSPRYLDLPYNLSHSEWKITLGMACGLPAICSPVPSYLDVERAARKGAVTVCRTQEEWHVALEQAIDDRRNWGDRSRAARQVVETVYGSEVVAAKHVETVRSA